jgi:hypothetical protein
VVDRLSRLLHCSWSRMSERHIRIVGSSERCSPVLPGFGGPSQNLKSFLCVVDENGSMREWNECKNEEWISKVKARADVTDSVPLSPRRF